MPKCHGLIVHFDETQRGYFLLAEKEGQSFSDALSVHDWEIKQRQIVLISFSGNAIDYICLATKGKRVTTAKSRVEFFDLVRLESISIRDIEQLLSKDTKLHFMRSSSGRGGSIPEKTWQACAGSRYARWDVQVAIAPSISAQLMISPLRYEMPRPSCGRAVRFSGAQEARPQ